MKVSVIIPVYNVKDYLNKCFDSIANQSYKKIEILVVDDGSNDGSSKVCDEYANKDERIKAFHLENGGAAAARNFAIKKATGDYLFFVDADDYIELDTIEKMVNLTDNGQKDIVYCDYYKYFDDGTTEYVKLIPFELTDDKVHILAMPGPVCKLIKKELFTDNNLYFLNDKCFEDNAIMPLVSAYAKSTEYLKEPKYYYLQREGSALNKKEYNPKWEDIFEVLNYLYNGFVQTGKYDDFYDELEYIYIEYLLHAANLRFLDYEEGIKNITLVSNVMKTKFPDWQNNKYYKMENIKYKIICNLFYKNKINLIKKILRR